MAKIKTYQKAPFPYFGGKSDAAETVWAALGDPEHYVEPFAGSMAVLLNRPHLANRTYHSETVNDLDGLLVNAWRAIQLRPDETAEAASWPVSEVDLMARHIALVRWREEGVSRMRADAAFCDPVMAGWWLWGIACWIGGGWCAGDGPWTERDGLVVKQPPVKRGRAAGVFGKLPHLANNGQGVNAPQLREPGVSGQLPHLTSNGRGVNAPQLREPGVEFHELTMPELRAWFGWLSARLRHVRILQGDWARTLTPSASQTLSVCKKGGVCGVFLDPPYADTAGRDAAIYAHDDLDVAHKVREWCLANGDNPKYRIVLAGFEGEHGTALTDAGWRELEWFKGGFLKGGMGNQTKTRGSGSQQKRERLWLSPHCLGADGPDEPESDSLFG